MTAKLNLKSLAPVAGGLLLAALVAGVLLHRDEGKAPEGLVFTNGRLESDRIAVASKVPGRIATMLHQEGELVEAGTLLAELDDSQIRPKVDAARAQVDALTAQLAAKTAEVAVARKEVPLGIAASEDQLARARAQAEQTRRDADRMARLREQGVIDAHHAEQATLAAVAAVTQRDQADKQLASARLGHDKVAASETALKALQGQLDAAKAQLAEAQAALDETRVKAPVKGVIAVRAREAGEVVGAGGTLFELYDPAQLYLRAYVPETEIGKLKLGLAARVWIDAAPDHPYTASLTHIANRAEFTPKEVQTHNERVKQVFAVKLLLVPEKDVRLAPGLPADAAIRYREDAAWKSPQ
ncbi:HlyD family efflux transporter periplasmic adaptor subunit [Burkholderiaceae bacterium DAT-1]|nr:HlyD family efflux transporter periplasmic adaptor subunit [Burkholderiaceae bacterium DAT-1]